MVKLIVALVLIAIGISIVKWVGAWVASVRDDSDRRVGRVVSRVIGSGCFAVAGVILLLSISLTSAWRMWSSRELPILFWPQPAPSGRQRTLGKRLRNCEQAQ